MPLFTISEFSDFKYFLTFRILSADLYSSFSDSCSSLVVKNSNSTQLSLSVGLHFGKSFFASALDHQACTQGYRVAYFNVQKLLLKTKMSRIDGTVYKLFEKISRAELLILDDFGLTHLEQQQRMDMMEIIEDRHASRATIIASQLPVSKWYDIIGENTIADALLDRMVHTSYRIELKGESLRKKR